MNTEPSDHSILGDALHKAIAEQLADLGEIDPPTEHSDFERRVSAATGRALDDLAGTVLAAILQSIPDTLASQRSAIGEGQAMIARAWGDALDLLEVFVGICVESGEGFHQRYGEQAALDADYSTIALTRIQARSCLVAREALTLLRAGYASGANTRWRTLHELSVVALFISEHGDDLAHRYLLHDAIQAYKATCSYRDYAARLGLEPLSDEEFQKRKTRRDELHAAFGPDFCNNQYGWAAELVSDKGRTFAGIERAIQLDHLRPLYGLASHSVHPNARGSFFDLGVGDDEDLMLAGPSTRGLADPAVSTCISLQGSTNALLNERPNVDEVVIVHVLQALVLQLIEAFQVAHDAHEKAAATE